MINEREKLFSMGQPQGVGKGIIPVYLKLYYKIFFSDQVFKKYLYPELHIDRYKKSLPFISGRKAKKSITNI